MVLATIKQTLVFSVTMPCSTRDAVPCTVVLEKLKTYLSYALEHWVILILQTRVDRV